MKGRFFLYDYREGDVVRLKKRHPCGSFEWTLIRTGSDCKMTCSKCGRLLVMKRPDLEKATTEVIPAALKEDRRDNNG